MMARTIRDVIRAGTNFDKKWNDAILWRSRQSDWALCTGAIGLGGLAFVLVVTPYILAFVLPATLFSAYCYKLCRQRAKQAARAADRAHRKQLRIIEQAVAAEDEILHVATISLPPPDSQ